MATDGAESPASHACDEWAINRDREIQAAKGIDVASNDIVMAMARHGLRHVEYGKKEMRPLSETEQQRLDDSAAAAAQAAVDNRERYRPDDPSLLTALLKHHHGNVAERKRIFRDFFQQFSKTELRALRHEYTSRPNASAVVEGEESLHLSDEELRNDEAAAAEVGPSHPFVARSLQWLGLLQSNHFAAALLTDAIMHEPPAIDKDALWYRLVLEFKDTCGGP